MNLEEAKRLRDAHLAPDSAALFAWYFIEAWARGRFEEARACLDVDSSIHPDTIGDPNADGVTFVVFEGGWGIWGAPQLSDTGDEVVTFVRAPEGILVRGGVDDDHTTVQFIVRRRDDHWGIVRILRYGC